MAVKKVLVVEAAHRFSLGNEHYYRKAAALMQAFLRPGPFMSQDIHEWASSALQNIFIESG